MATVVVNGSGKIREYLKSISAKLNGKTILKVGFLAGATYPDGTPVAMVAAIQEFGAPAAGIPPRPFFRDLVAKHGKDWAAGMAVQLKETNYDPKLALERTGQAIAGQLKQSIIDTNSPPLKPATIARKGFAKPLVDTGQLLNSVDYEVVSND
jgi:hypothetical protein